jgi:hypothetical protein
MRSVGKGVTIRMAWTLGDKGLSGLGRFKRRWAQVNFMRDWSKLWDWGYSRFFFFIIFYFIRVANGTSIKQPEAQKSRGGQ